jgi:hypothetical protein
MGVGIPPNLNLLWDIPSARGYVPLTLAHTATLLPLDTVPALLPLLAPRDRRLDVAAVRFVIVPAGEAAPALAALRADPRRFRELAGTGGDHVFENLRAFPAVWIVHDTIAIADDDAQAVAHFGDPRFDPAHAALVSDPRAAIPHRGATAGDRVAVTSGRSGEVDLAVSCASACMVVTSDALYPGWSGSVDGVAVPLVRADVALRGIAVGAGNHRVTLTYRPWSLYAGAAISVSALVVLLALLRPSRSTTAATPVLQGLWTSPRPLPPRSSSST